jgi:hypothetical protein
MECGFSATKIKGGRRKIATPEWAGIESGAALTRTGYKGMTDLRQAVEHVQRLTETWSAPYRDAASASDLQAIEFAKFMIQSLLLLHGGAMVAVPAFAQLLPFSPNQVVVLGTLVALFGVGLVSSACAGVLGFLALANRSDANATLVDAAGPRAWAYVLDLDHKLTGNAEFATASAQAREQAEAFTRTAQPFFRRFRSQRATAIGFMFVSVATLIGASLVGILAISNKFSLIKQWLLTLGTLLERALHGP